MAVPVAYTDALMKSTSCLLGAWRDCRDCGWDLALRTLQENASLTRIEVLLFLLGVIGWTLLRHATSLWLFRPFAQWCGLQPKDAAKVPESAWKLLFYTISWSYSAYLLLCKDYPFFHDPPSAFHDWKRGIQVPEDIALAYLWQSSFYGHSTYAIFYMDAWRKDSVVMLVHHIVAVILITFSYVFRYHNIGLLVLFLHDVNDIQLEFTKLNVYFKNRGGSYHQLNDFISNISCIIFSVSWFWFRLYWFPQKVLYATCCSSLQSFPNIPFYFFFNILLLLVFLMDIYWFLFIVVFVGKVLAGQMREVSDVREYDHEDSQKLTLQRQKEELHSADSSKGQHLKNGIIKSKEL
ncbi:ceramide synthase 1 [Microcaecilia unicolor]|uniref:Ceramide synthase 1 n=1 Tax=Microcaecilia unicolor TaxID=1415580 RepID=A0A6P7ZAG5_9AMPH|nr:ceramide synthase 1 [Microcaecilia unicolor]